MKAEKARKIADAVDKKSRLTKIFNSDVKKMLEKCYLEIEKAAKRGEYYTDIKYDYEYEGDIVSEIGKILLSEDYTFSHFSECFRIEWF